MEVRPLTTALVALMPNPVAWLFVYTLVSVVSRIRQGVQSTA
jgi:hypothetical protein